MCRFDAGFRSSVLGRPCASTARGRARSTFIGVALPALLPTLLILWGGCAAERKPIFEPPQPPLVWPAPPAPARMRYVGQIATSEDLKRPPKAMESLANLFAGKKPPESLYGPRDVLVTGHGRRLWVADPGGRCVHLFDLEERKYSKIELAGQSRLMSPVGLARGPDGSIYVCDSQDVAIHRLSSTSGELLETLRLPEDLIRPAALIYREEDRSLIVADVLAHDLKILETNGHVRRIIGQRGSAPGQFNFPSDIADDGRMIWVADTGNQRVQGLSYTGEPLVSFGQAGDAPGDLALPKAVATDSDGHVYIVDGRFENVQVFDRKGRLLMFLGEEGTGPGEFWLPAGLFIDADDRIWVCDSYNRRIQVFDYVKRAPAAEADGNRAASPPQPPGEVTP